MNFFKALFGGQEEKPEDKKRTEDDRNFDVLKYDGVRALRSGQHDYAIKCFTHALQIKEDLEIRDYLSQACIRADRIAEAYENLLKIVDAQPDNAHALLRLANVAYMMEDYAAMTDACQKALQADDKSAEATYLYAKACIGLGDTTQAIELLTTAIEMKPDFSEAYLLRGETHLAAGDTVKAGEDADILLKSDGDNEDALILKARVERTKDNSAEAIHYYNKVIEANPFNGHAYVERGETKLATGDENGGNDDIKEGRELLSQQGEDANGNGIEAKVREAYKNVNPLGI